MASWVGHIRPPAGLLGVPGVVGRAKKSGPSAQGKKEREGLGPNQAETGFRVRSSRIHATLRSLKLTETWA